MTVEEPRLYVPLPQADEVSSSTNEPILGRVVDDTTAMRNGLNVTANRNSHSPEDDDTYLDSEATALRSCHPSLTKTNVGAACVGALIGTIFFGPIGGIIFAVAAGYATTYSEGNIGHYAREIGDKAYAFISKAAKAAKASTARR